jgi:ElaA protein
MTPARTVRWATFAELDTTTLYRLLRLRVDVFVVEQQCAYPDLDGRDLEAGTLHGWIEDVAGPVAYVRLLFEPGATRIGRVATAPAHRGSGLAARLVEAALARSVGPVVLDAQSRLCDWYRRYGFVATGPEYLDDGIPHVPMRLDR